MNISGISVIVPVYNVEQHLHECIESILNQTYKEFELILINDGSRDNSLEICREYALRDQRVRLIDKENGGVSTARNIGIEAAVAEWITFIDSDDYVASDYLEKMVSAIGEGSDFVQSGIVFFDSSSGRETGREILPDKLCMHRTDSNQCFLQATLALITSPVSKLYRRDLLISNGICFDTAVTVGEDRDFNLAYISVIERSNTIDYAGYYYRKGISGNLSSNKDYMQLLRWDIDYWNRLSNFFISNCCDVDTTEKYLAHRLFNIYNDRLVQYVNARRCSYGQLVRTVKDIVCQSEYLWLCRHFDVVECNRMVAMVYRSKSPVLLSMYLKALCKRNG